MDANTTSWAVVATVDEPVSLLQAFVAWYLHLGAEEIILCFDRPDDPASDSFAHVAQVTTIRCDAAHWEMLGKERPEKHQIRQVRNATYAYRQTKADWLLHCDADEFLTGDQPISACLAQVYPWSDGAIVPVAERIYLPGGADSTIFAGAFRRPFPKASDAGATLFGPDYALTARGLTGHAVGKSFVRTGRGYEVSIHRPRVQKGVPIGDPKTEILPGAELLHFDGLTPLHWIFKLLRKADAHAHHGGMDPSPHRQQQIDALSAQPRAAMALHDRLKRPDADLVEKLTRNGLLITRAFDPTEAFAALDWAMPDLTPAAFDAWLIRSKGAAFPHLTEIGASQ